MDEKILLRVLLRWINKKQLFLSLGKYGFSFYSIPCHGIKALIICENHLQVWYPFMCYASKGRLYNQFFTCCVCVCVCVCLCQISIYKLGRGMAFCMNGGGWVLFTLQGLCFICQPQLDIIGHTSEGQWSKAKVALGDYKLSSCHRADVIGCLKS